MRVKRNASIEALRDEAGDGERGEDSLCSVLQAVVQMIARLECDLRVTSILYAYAEETGS